MTLTPVVCMPYEKTLSLASAFKDSKMHCTDFSPWSGLFKMDTPRTQWTYA